ncbi:MAG: LysM peptidoglycan-binding domain-containing protein [Staphylococcus equorum]|nr:LysM peptidoglycan-binding domain-containing protein [Lactococcus lactis]MDN6160436.1 LysM peptidoglycan-binding domain-containing protein [Staphylococcus equorum]MDN6120204.1 LysM peptidoglycan-binding domain-containing protein [Lactococcus lactis]MDN6504865.1 LysM peptidoglycan-binding domain-containing protein [Lactococcus lactis]MDN6570136.1 LysM peptidoglycan-binding domain-containing protein [Staphylococcus equorum]
MKKLTILTVATGTLLTLGATLPTYAKAEEVKEGNTTFYVVESGDTLSKISEKYGVHFSVTHANNANQISNADLIFEGQKLIVDGEGFDKTKAPVVSTAYKQDEVQTSTQGDETPVESAPEQAPVQEAPPAPATNSAPAQASGIDLNQTSGSVDINALANYLAGAGMSAGYSASEWAYIIQRESNGSVTVANASSGAYGVLQLLGHGEYQGMTLGEQINMARGLPAGSWVVYP